MRKWIGLAVALAVIAGLVLLGVSMARGVLAFMNGANARGTADPMFAEPAETVTRPPSLSGEDGEAADLGDDPSKNWHYETLTPLTEDGLAAES